MANHHPQPSPPGSGLHMHHGPQGGHQQVNGHVTMQMQQKITPAHLASLNEIIWLNIGIQPPIRDSRQRSWTGCLLNYLGSASELMNDLDGALNAYEQALRHNYQSITAMNAISCILRTKESFPRAVEYLQGILKLESNNGEVWGSLGK